MIHQEISGIQDLKECRKHNVYIKNITPDIQLFQFHRLNKDSHSIALIKFVKLASQVDL